MNATYRKTDMVTDEYLTQGLCKPPTKRLCKEINPLTDSTNQSMTWGGYTRRIGVLARPRQISAKTPVVRSAPSDGQSILHSGVTTE